MQGVRYLTDEKGKRVAVQIDLREHGELWEDLQDALVAKQRRNEPREDWETVKQALRKSGKLK